TTGLSDRLPLPYFRPRSSGPDGTARGPLRASNILQTPTSVQRKRHHSRVCIILSPHVYPTRQSSFADTVRTSWLSSGLAAIQGAKDELQKAATPGRKSDGVVFELRLIRNRPLATYHRWPAEQPLKRSGAQVVPPHMCCDDKYCRHGCADHISFEKGLGTGADQQRQYEQVSNIDGQRQPTS